MKDDYVRVTSTSPSPRTAKVTIGDQEIRVRSLTIRMAAGELTTIVLETLASHVDVAALQQHTQLRLLGAVGDEYRIPVRIVR